MRHAQYFAADEYMTLWDILRRWKNIPMEELELLINYSGGRRPSLPPHEMWQPASGKPTSRGSYLRPLGRVQISLDGDLERLCRIVDNEGHIYSCNVDMMSDETGEPMGELYFLVSDVARLEQENPDYLAEPLAPLPTTQSTAPKRRNRATPEVPTAAMSPDAMVRAKQGAQLIGIGKSTFDTWVREGKLPPGKKLTPGVTVWRFGDLLDALDALESNS